MQNRLNVFGALILSMGLILAGCSKKSDQSSPSAAERQFLSLGTAPPGGAFFVVGSAIAEVVIRKGRVTTCPCVPVHLLVLALKVHCVEDFVV